MVNSHRETLKPYRTSVLSLATQQYDVSHIMKQKSCNYGMDLSRIRVRVMKNLYYYHKTTVTLNKAYLACKVKDKMQENIL